MKNSEYLMYTYMHRQAFRFVVKMMITDECEKRVLMERAKWHDLDKSLLYLLTPKDVASNWHREHCSHHMNNDLPKTKEDLMEAVIDYECAGFTKPDKTRNAYDTVRELQPKHSDELFKIMEKWGCKKSYLNLPDDTLWKAYIKRIPKDEENAIAEVLEYIFAKPKEAEQVFQYAKKFMNVQEKWKQAKYINE